MVNVPDAIAVVAMAIGSPVGAASNRLPVASPGVWRALAVAAALAAVSLVVVAPAPSYDPWMWLLWGREVADGAAAVGVLLCGRLLALTAAGAEPALVLAAALGAAEAWAAGRRGLAVG